MSDLRADKAIVRARLRTALAALDLAEVAQLSARIITRIEAEPTYVAAKTVMMFHPMAARPEVDLRPLIRRALAAGRRVALPRIDWPTRGMTARVIASLDTDLEPDLGGGSRAMGLLQPKATCPVIDAATIDLLLVPGLGFDDTGGRIGNGAGFYDRFLAQPGIEGDRAERGGRGLICGVGFEVQVLPRGSTLPREPHDRLLGALATESRIQWFGARAGVGQTGAG